MIRWRNLWGQFILAPGTRQYRILLALWQVWLMLGAGLALLVYVGVSWGALASLAGGFAAAWISHELLFIAYAEKVVGLEEPDRHPFETVQEMGAHPHYIATIERYWGPFGSDPTNERSG